VYLIPITIISLVPITKSFDTPSPTSHSFSITIIPLIPITKISSILITNILLILHQQIPITNITDFPSSTSLRFLITNIYFILHHKSLFDSPSQASL
ncbi:hypothetical protein Bpfe_006824, partial [Biomphalaria pfeifferi]